jgi:hypothetical protein
MLEKCYREIQAHGQLGGVSIIEIMILLAFPIMLAPIFTWLGLNLLFVLALDLILYALLRFGNRISGFDYGVVSFFSFNFIWPRRLSGFNLDEHDYLKQAPSHSDKK